MKRYINVPHDLVYVENKQTEMDCSILKDKNIVFVGEDDEGFWIENEPFTGRVRDIGSDVLSEIQDIFDRAEIKNNPPEPESYYSFDKENWEWVFDEKKKKEALKKSIYSKRNELISKGIETEYGLVSAGDSSRANLAVKINRDVWPIEWELKDGSVKDIEDKESTQKLLDKMDDYQDQCRKWARQKKQDVEDGKEVDLEEGHPPRDYIE